jgi:hypothetical protein
METRIAVAGATGRVGRQVLDVLEGFGYPTVVVTREGLDEALAGVYAIVDAECSEAAARDLQRAGARAGVERIVAVCVTGDHERATLAGPVPGRVVRAAPFPDARAVADRLARLAVLWSWEAVPAITEIGEPALPQPVDSAA